MQEDSRTCNHMFWTTMFEQDNGSIVVIDFTEVGTSSKLWWGAELWAWVIDEYRFARFADGFLMIWPGGSMLSCLAECTGDNVPAYPSQDAKIGFPTDLTSSARTWKSCKLSSTMWFTMTFKGLRLTLAEVVPRDPKGCIESWTQKSTTKTLYKDCCWF